MDTETNRLLGKAGWRVERVWENKDPDEAADRLVEIVNLLQKG
jgi:hypothetical protein